MLLHYAMFLILAGEWMMCIFLVNFCFPAVPIRSFFVLKHQTEVIFYIFVQVLGACAGQLGYGISSSVLLWTSMLLSVQVPSCSWCWFHPALQLSVLFPSQSHSFYAQQHICYSAYVPSQFHLSVLLSHGWISQKRLKLGLYSFHPSL